MAKATKPRIASGPIRLPRTAGRANDRIGDGSITPESPIGAVNDVDHTAACGSMGPAADGFRARKPRRRGLTTESTARLSERHSPLMRAYQVLTGNRLVSTVNATCSPEADPVVEKELAAGPCENPAGGSPCSAKSADKTPAGGHPVTIESNDAAPGSTIAGGGSLRHGEWGAGAAHAGGPRGVV